MANVAERMRREIVALVNAGSSPVVRPLFRDGVTGNTLGSELRNWKFESSSRSQFFETKDVAQRRRLATDDLRRQSKAGSLRLHRMPAWCNWQHACPISE